MDDSDDSHYWYSKSEYGRPQSIMSKISSRFNHRPSSRQGINIYLFILFKTLTLYFLDQALLKARLPQCPFWMKFCIMQVPQRGNFLMPWISNWTRYQPFLMVNEFHLFFS